MEKIKIEKNYGGLKDVRLITPKVFSDNRGDFSEVYNQQDFYDFGITANFVQDNLVHNNKNVLRGMHVNIIHPQAKLIQVLAGRIFDVIVDLRKESSTYKKWASVELSAENKKILYIPEGFGHGYYSYDISAVVFKVTTHYVSGDEIGFAWNSSELNIQWPKEAVLPVLCDRDACNPQFGDELLWRASI